MSWRPLQTPTKYLAPQIDATLPQHAQIRFAVVARVSLNVLRFVQRSSAPAGDGLQADKQRHELSGVMTIRTRDNYS